ncbi:MAG: glycosyltransferase [Marinilabiliaceae bacterium]
MTMLSAALWVALVPYCLVVAACAFLFVRSVRRRRKAVEADCTGKSPLSVVMCTCDADAATCAENMRCVASSLRADDSLIVVADHVSARSLDMLRRAAVACGSVRVVENDGLRGKKNAQRTGVRMAAGDIIVSADADCRVDVRFAEAVRMSAYEFGGKPFMLLLPVEMRGGGSLLGRLMELEFGCLQVVTAGTALSGSPTMANGAGMAFSKCLYEGHDSRPEYASGDDMFLLAHALRSGAPVRYLPAREAVVSSVVPPGLGAYLRQRTRWLGKAGGYRSAGVIALALVVFAAVMSWPVAAVAAALGLASWRSAVGLFAVKLMADASACAAWLIFRNGWRGLKSLWLSLPLELLYPLMAVVVACRAAVADRSRW